MMNSSDRAKKLNDKFIGYIRFIVFTALKAHDGLCHRVVGYVEHTVPISHSDAAGRYVCPKHRTGITDYMVS